MESKAKHNRNWSPSDDRWLRANYGSKPIAEVLTHLGRTKYAVMARWTKLNKTKRSYTPRAVKSNAMPIKRGTPLTIEFADYTVTLSKDGIKVSSN